MPTVSWLRTDSAINSSTPPVVFQALVSVLLAQGWTIEYADTNAIGTGSAGAPKFDSVAYASGASLGRMIVVMPLGSLSTQWRVQIEGRWGTTGGAWKIEVTTGTGQAAGALSDPGTTIIAGPTTTSCSNQEYWVAAHVNELWISFPATHSLGLGRKRTLAGTSLDDLAILGIGYNTSYITGFPAPIAAVSPTAGLSLVRNVVQGEYTAARALVWGGINNGSYMGPETLTDGGGNYGYPVGPFLMGNGPGGFPRLWAIFPTSDIPVSLNNFTVSVDGADRLFFVPGSSAGMVLNGCRWAFAKE